MNIAHSKIDAIEDMAGQITSILFTGPQLGRFGSLRRGCDKLQVRCASD
jgi:hypothetical protein